MTDGKQMRIGIPKGSEATIKLFAKAGWKITSHHRNYFPGNQRPGSDLLPVPGSRNGPLRGKRPPSMPVRPARTDLENQSDVVVVDDLIYSKASNRPAKWVLAVAGDSHKRPEDLAGKQRSPRNWSPSPAATSTSRHSGRGRILLGRDRGQGCRRAGRRHRRDHRDRHDHK